MTAPTVRALGRDLHALEPVETFGTFLGLGRGAAFRSANAGAWPMVGSKGARRVIVPAALDQLGIPYQAADAPHECACREVGNDGPAE